MITTALHPYALARLAGCGDPDTAVSPGANFLLGIAEAVAELHVDADEDTAHEIADAAVPTYTHEVWRAFVDLSAYREDVAEFLEDGADLTRSAAVALFMIGERLAAALLAEVA